jgi:hypothetical protein
LPGIRGFKADQAAFLSPNGTRKADKQGNEKGSAHRELFQ